MSELKNYKPKKFNEVKLGDSIWTLYTHGVVVPIIHEYEVVEITDVDLQYPTRHWKRFGLREIVPEKDKQLSYPTITMDGNPAQYPIDIYGFDFDSYVQEWCQDRVFADKKLAFHALYSCLKRKIKKNKGRQRKIESHLSRQTKMLEKMLEVFPEEEMKDFR